MIKTSQLIDTYFVNCLCLLEESAGEMKVKYNFLMNQIRSCVSTSKEPRACIFLIILQEISTAMGNMLHARGIRTDIQPKVAALLCSAKSKPAISFFFLTRKVWKIRILSLHRCILNLFPIFGDSNFELLPFQLWSARQNFERLLCELADIWTANIFLHKHTWIHHCFQCHPFWKDVFHFLLFVFRKMTFTILDNDMHENS